MHECRNGLDLIDILIDTVLLYNIRYEYMLIIEERKKTAQTTTYGVQYVLGTTPRKIEPTRGVVYSTIMYSSLL
jgi:hypothetical protein